MAAELALLSMPRRAMRGMMPAARHPGAPAVVVGLVGVQLAGPAAWPAAPAPRTGGIASSVASIIVLSWRLAPAERQAERRAAGIDDEVALRARLAPVRRVRAGRRAPFFAGTVRAVERRPAQSICPAPPAGRAGPGAGAAQTPAACQSRSRRQQVMPDPQPISAGRSSHGKPVRSTNRMPVSAARSGIGAGRPSDAAERAAAAARSPPRDRR